MLSRRAFPPTFASLLAGLSSSAQAAPPSWVGHDIPPFLWRGATGPEGYAFHLFQRVVKQAGVAAQLQIYPWARAFRMLQAGHAHAALVVTRTPEREAQFRWLFPVGRFRYAVFTRQPLVTAPGELAALKSLRVGALRASVGRSLLEPAGVTQVVEGKDFVELLALLNRGIVDAVFGPEPVLRMVDTRAGGEGLRITPFNQPHEFYAVASSAMSDAHVQRLRAAYQHLVDTGAVAQLRKTHPDAWFPE
jgi:polar amino acid transport system substrate-binding protein